MLSLSSLSVPSSAHKYATRLSTSALVGTASSPKIPQVLLCSTVPRQCPHRYTEMKPCAKVLTYVRELCHIRDDRLADFDNPNDSIVKSTVGLQPKGQMIAEVWCSYCIQVVRVYACRFRIPD
jgi:hypothetical protein